MVWVMRKAMLLVGAMTCGMVYLVQLSVFDTIFTEVGLQFYAEKYSSKTQKIFPPWLNMPYNTFVNFGYVIVGAYYCAKTSANIQLKQMKEEDGFMFFVFNLMASVYGPIQAVRILTQFHRSAVLDQWYTLPFFIWVFVWSKHLCTSINYTQMTLLITLSLSSYFMTVLSMFGFEIALSFHILMALFGAFRIYRKYPVTEAQEPLVWALISCVGFVALKLVDLELPKINQIFEKISGHFLSKIADICQIVFVNQYFEVMTDCKYNEQNKKSE